jgi:hypothetical protein
VQFFTLTVDGSGPVPMFESDSGGLPGTTPGTRVVG